MSVSSEPVLPPRSDREREVAAWWFRQLCTTLTLANAGGVIAVSGFAANTQEIAVAALIAHPATTFFLAGAVVGSFGIILQFLYASWWLEAVAEHEKQRNEWRSQNGMNLTISVVPTVTFLVIASLTILTMVGSSVYFFRGAKHASLSTAALACASLNDPNACETRVLLFGRVPEPLKANARRAIKVPAPQVDASTRTATIHPDALPKVGEKGVDRRNHFVMRRAAELVARNPRCRVVELVMVSATDPLTVSVSCSGSEGIVEFKITEEDALGLKMPQVPEVP